MSRMMKHLMQDGLIIIVSVFFALYVAETGLAHKIVETFAGYQLLGVFISGLFFTSVFTTAPSIALLGAFAETTPLPVLALVGGLGALCGDYIIFKFVKSRMSSDLNYLLSFSGRSRLRAIFRTKIFRFFVPFIGALIIASPFPDELGIAMMGISKMKDRVFFAISLVMNSIGIFIIGWLARIIIG